MQKNKRKKLNACFAQEVARKKRKRKIVLLILLCVFVSASLAYGSIAVLVHVAKNNTAEIYKSSSRSDAVVSFGTYPQTQETDASVLAGLNALTPEWKYYKDCTARKGYYETISVKML